MAWTVTMSVYLDENPKMRRANEKTEGRAELVFGWLLRLARRRGFGVLIPAAYSEPAEIARNRQMPLDMVVKALAACVEDRILQIHEDGAIEILPDEDWDQPMTPAERKAAQRAREMPSVRNSGTVTHVTSSHDRSRNERDTRDSGHVESRESRSGSGPILSCPVKEPAAVAAGAQGSVHTPDPAHSQTGQVDLIPAAPPRIAQKGGGSRGESKPLPFLPVDLFRVLHEASRGRFATDGTPLDRGQSIAVVKTIRAMEAKGYTLADVKLAGEFVASWQIETQMSVGWVMKRDGLFDNIGKARAWAERGRPALGRAPAGGSRPPVDYEDVDAWRARTGAGNGGSH